MEVLILGGTGRTGKHLLKECLDAGIQVTALVRKPKKVQLEHKNLKLIQGTPESEDDLRRAIEGVDAVLNTLNISRVSDFPWAKLRTPEDFLEKVMKSTLQLCEEQGLRRVIITSAWGVGDSLKEIPKWFKWIIDNSNVGKAYAQHEVQEKLLADSDLDYTIVRPVGLTNGQREKKLLRSKQGQPKPRMMISRRMVAKYMVQCLLVHLHVKETITLS